MAKARSKAKSRSMMFGMGIGAIAGAATAMLFDPAAGRRRRALIRDKAVHAGKTVSGAVRGTALDLANRARGARASVGGLFRRGPVSDDVLVERVRAKLGRSVSHPHAVHVDALEGRVTVSGPILADEAASLLSAIRRVKGVSDVVDQLEKQV